MLALADSSAEASAKEEPPIPKLYLDLLKKAFKGDLNPLGQEWETTTIDTAQRFMQAVFEGYGGNFSNLAYDTPDFHKLRHLERNVYQFSGAKNWQMLRDLTNTVKETGSYRDFRNKALTILDEYQGNWLKTEYNAAVAGAQMASKWVDFEKHPEALLEYRTMEDGRVRAEHAAIDRTIRPVDDAFWKTYYPPNGWNCRCTVIRLNSGTPTPEKDIQHIEVPKMFQVNLGQQGLVFPKGSAYYINCPKEVTQKATTLAPDRTKEK